MKWLNQQHSLPWATYSIRMCMCMYGPCGKEFRRTGTWATDDTGHFEKPAQNNEKRIDRREYEKQPTVR